MKFVWHYIRRKLRDLHDDPEENMAMPMSRGAKLSTVSMSPESDWGEGLNIQVHTAHGGRIVTFRKYDRRSDRSNNQVYLIPDDRDFERELGKLITLEAMRG